MKERQSTIPLFPLNTVLFPEGPLPLRIFEPRYLDMVSECLRRDLPFGVSLIRTGEEVGTVAEAHEVGTLARIVDWRQRQDGLLGITAVGEERFRIISTETKQNRLSEALVEILEPEETRDIPAEYLTMADLSRQLIRGIGKYYETLGKRYGDATWVGNRLAELLPIPLDQKQYLMALTDPVQRLERLHDVMASMHINY